MRQYKSFWISSPGGETGESFTFKRVTPLQDLDEVKRSAGQYPAINDYKRITTACRLI